MIPGFIAIIFLVLFSVVLVAISLGYRFLEAQRKKQVAGMLEVVSGNAPSDAAPSILIEPSEADPLEAILRSSEISSRLSTMIQQSGLPWSPSRLIAMMLMFGIAGAVVGFVFRPLGFLLLSTCAGAALVGSLPYIYLRVKRSKRMNEFEQQLPEALDFLARSMRAGHAFSISIEMLGAESPDPLGI